MSEFRDLFSSMHPVLSKGWGKASQEARLNSLIYFYYNLFQDFDLAASYSEEFLKEWEGNGNQANPH